MTPTVTAAATGPATDRPRIALLDPDFYAADPRPAYAWMRRNAPVFRDDTSGLWGVASYAALTAAEADPQVFSSAQGSRPTGHRPLPHMIDMDDPEHWKRRKLVNRGFTPRRVAAHEPRIREICDALIDDAAEQGACEFVSAVAAQLPLIVIADLLGVLPDDRAQLLAWTEGMLGAQGALEGPARMTADEALRGYTEFALKAIEQRRAHPTEDLISVLAHAEVDGDRLDDHELVHESLLILVGGDETTRHVITGGIAQVLRRPAVADRLRTTPGDIPSAVEEMLRWVSPVKNMNRTVTRDVEFFGARLRSGDQVLLLYESANFDETHFTDPDRFDVDRSPNDHVAFGLGTHFCLGASLARLELCAMTERLLTRLPDLRLDTDVDPARRRNNFITGIERMPVRFTPVPKVGARA